MNPLIIALDVKDETQMLDIVSEVGETVDFYKVGLQLFLGNGEKTVKILQALEKKVFLDLKLFDIPNTVYQATRQALRLQPELFTLHCLGGKEMLEAAVKARNETSEKTKLLGVTLLTSMDVKELNISNSDDFVVTMAELALSSGLNGIVCSAADVKNIRRKLGSGFLIVCPGIRTTVTKDDQKRTGSPREALSAGADFLVVGRPVLEAADKKQAALNLLAD